MYTVIDKYAKLFQNVIALITFKNKKVFVLELFHILGIILKYKPHFYFEIVSSHDAQTMHDKVYHQIWFTMIKNFQ